jgi:hypothetical protein
MAKKDFSSTRGILNRKPKINFVEPEQVAGEQVPVVEVETPLLERKAQVQQLIAQYKRVEQLSDLAQKRIDVRAKNMRICLDPRTDANIIDALHRKFGDVESCVTYAQYKHCLDEISQIGQRNAKDLIPKAGVADPFRTDLGGYTTENGTLRPEVQFASPIEEIDQDKFQKDAVSKLFKMMLPMLTQLTDSKVLQHLLTASHG